MKPITTPISPKNSTLQKVQSTSGNGVPEEATLCEHPRPRDADETLVLPDSYHQAIRDLERQIKTLGEKIDAFTDARESITQTLRTDEQTLRTDEQVRSVFNYDYLIFIRNLERRRILLTRSTFRVS